MNNEMIYLAAPTLGTTILKPSCWPCMFWCSHSQEAQSWKDKTWQGSRPAASSQEEERLSTRNKKAEEAQQASFRTCSWQLDLHKQTRGSERTSQKEKWQENKTEAACRRCADFTSQPSQKEQDTVWEQASQEEETQAEERGRRQNVKWTLAI